MGANRSTPRPSGYQQPTNWRAIRSRILNRDGHTCYSCQGTATTVDHLLPVAQGGTHDDGNLAAMCWTCHQAKTKTESKQGKALRSRRREQEQHPGRIVR